MQRAFASLLASTFLVALAGCGHIAGVCDCDPHPFGHPGCCGNGWSFHGGPVIAAPAPAAEQLKELPKAADKGM